MSDGNSETREPQNIVGKDLMQGQQIFAKPAEEPRKIPVHTKDEYTQFVGRDSLSGQQNFSPTPDRGTPSSDNPPGISRRGFIAGALAGIAAVVGIGTGVHKLNDLQNESAQKHGNEVPTQADLQAKATGRSQQDISNNDALKDDNITPIKIIKKS